MSNEFNTSGINTSESFEEYLEHHGIKGMHWGIRRTPEQLGHLVTKHRENFERYTQKAQKAADEGNSKRLSKYTKKAEKTNKKVVKLHGALEKALKKQAESDEKTVNKGTLEEVIAISDRLTAEQINKAYNRISAKQKLEGLRPSADSKLDKLVSLGGKAAKGAEHAYNIINNVNNFKGVMKDIQQSEIKEYEQAVEKERKSTVKKAIQTGSVAEFQKVWGQATLEELKDMSDTLKMRHEILNPDYSKPVVWSARQYTSGKQQEQKKK